MLDRQQQKAWLARTIGSHAGRSTRKADLARVDQDGYRSRATRTGGSGKGRGGRSVRAAAALLPTHSPEAMKLRARGNAVRMHGTRSARHKITTAASSRRVEEDGRGEGAGFGISVSDRSGFRCRTGNPTWTASSISRRCRSPTIYMMRLVSQIFLFLTMFFYSASVCVLMPVWSQARKDPCRPCHQAQRRQQQCEEKKVVVRRNQWRTEKPHT